MSTRSVDTRNKSRIILVRASDFLYRLMIFLTCTLGLGVLFNVLANIVTSPVSDFVSRNLPKPLTDWLKQLIHLSTTNPFVVALIMIIFLLLFRLAALGRQLEIPASEKELKHRYLSLLKEQTRTLVSKGSSKGPSVWLDDVFVAPLFYPLQLPPENELPLKKEDLTDKLNEDHLIYEGKKSEYFFMDEQDKVSLFHLWQNLCRDKPAAVIQGFPGTGKSTLLLGLVLYMAHRGLNEPSYAIGQAFDWFAALNPGFHPASHSLSGLTALRRLSPPLLPVFINLKEYGAYISASNRHTDDSSTNVADKQSSASSLSAYLEHTFAQFNIPELAAFLQQCLKKGRCLILLDGLDEVNGDIRTYVQEAIKNFIIEHRAITARMSKFNRFLITLRVTDYDQNVFPEVDYSFYVISELSPSQIDDFVTKYFHAVCRQISRFPRKKDVIISEATRRANLLREALKRDNNKNLRDLAKNPLLLSLLIALCTPQQPENPNQRKDFTEIPNQRIKLYERFTEMMLEGCNDLSKTRVIEKLDQLAMHMQEKDISLLSRSDVLAVLMQSLSSEIDTDEELKRAKQFLKHGRGRGGLFVQRIDNYFGFSHHTFQEYFAGHYMLRAIEQNSVQGIEQLVSRCCLSESWKQSFLLAVAHQSFTEKKVANQIIHALLDKLGTFSPTDYQMKEHIILLAAESLLEMKPFALEPGYKQKIVELLLQAYKDSSSNLRTDVCLSIKLIMRRLVESEEHTMSRTRQQFTKVVCRSLTSVSDDQIREEMIGMLCHLPICSDNEITFVWQLAENGTDKKIWEACARALEQADPKTPEAVEAIRAAAESTIVLISTAARECLKLRNIQ